MHDISEREKEAPRQGTTNRPFLRDIQTRAPGAYGGEELEKIVSKKSFRELSCNSNVGTNLEPDDDREVLRRIVCLKLKDDIHSPGELNGQMMALKEHVKARYKLSDMIRVQKNHKMTINFLKWIRTGVKEKGDLREDIYKIMSQFYKERRDLLYHTADDVVPCKRKDEKMLHKHNLILLPSAIPNGSVAQIARPD